MINCSQDSSNETQIKKSLSESTLTRLLYNNQICIRKQALYNVTQEFTILSKLSHANIIKVYEQDSQNSYIMEYCPNGDLNQNIPLLETTELTSTFLQMCQAVQYLHANNICHLDIKLENFVKDCDGNVKLIDFGHATYCEDKVKDVKGTECYNAPERYNGEYCGKKADIFSLGVCLTGMIAGFVPKLKNGKCFAAGTSYIKDKARFWRITEKESKKSVENFDEIDEFGIDLADLMLNHDADSRPDFSSIFQDEFFSG